MKIDIERLVNYQDVAIVNLVHERLELKEIAELEVSKVNLDNNTLDLNSRIIQVSTETIEVIIKAYHSQEYYCNNGESEDYFELDKSNKIIRGRVNEETTVKLIEKRIEDIKSYG